MQQLHVSSKVWDASNIDLVSIGEPACLLLMQHSIHPSWSTHADRGVIAVTSASMSQVTKLSKGEVLMLNIGSMCTGARVLAVKHDLAKLQLTSPVCTKEGEKVALSRRVEKHWRLIGWGQIQKGLKMDLPGRS